MAEQFAPIIASLLAETRAETRAEMAVYSGLAERLAEAEKQIEDRWASLTLPLRLGAWGADDLRRAFVAGASWWEFEKTGATIWNSDRNLAERAAEERYPGGRVPDEA